MSQNICPRLYLCDGAYDSSETEFDHHNGEKKTPSIILVISTCNHNSLIYLKW